MDIALLQVLCIQLCANRWEGVKKDLCF